MNNDDFDVVVVGSGPGGSVTATILAQKGYRVLIIEREKFPRFHVGESLLPATQPIWEQIGLAEKLQHSGHTFKYAGEFRIGPRPDQNRFYRTIGYFHNVPRKDFIQRPYGYQVERAVFDKQLQDNAVEHGVTLWEETAVTDVLLDDNNRATGLIVRRKDGPPEELNPSFIVDASGRRVMMGRKLNCVENDPIIRTSAVFGHFKGVQRDPGIRQGYFNGYFIPNGWVWFIPLANDVMSFGVVQNQPASDSWSNDPEEVMFSTINKYQFLQERFRNAVHTGRVRRLKDLAYQTKVFSGDGWLAVGDANFFVDPLYSSGVQIAHSTGARAAEAIDGFLKGGRDMTAIQKYNDYIIDYRRRVFRPMRSFYRCMRNYRTIAGYVQITGHVFGDFNTWFLRRACCWGTGMFHRHQWTIDIMSLLGNVGAWLAPKVGLGGWKAYERYQNPNPAIEIPKEVCHSETEESQQAPQMEYAG